ncbi:MAG: hypothetical protein AAB870_02235 [Patescibacteria group bacterium]
MHANGLAVHKTDLPIRKNLVDKELFELMLALVSEEQKMDLQNTEEASIEFIMFYIGDSFLKGFLQFNVAGEKYLEYPMSATLAKSIKNINN